MKQIGTALIGCGKVGETHAQAFATLEDSNFTAVFDLDEARSAGFASRYGVKPYTNLAKLLSDPNVEMASICTPHLSHPDIVVQCAEAGIHALVEKPLAVDLKGCDRAILSADEAGIKLGTISQRRFYEPVLRVKKAIEMGKIGEPILGTVTVMGWRDEGYYQMDGWRGKWGTEGGGVMVTQTTHQIDLFQWLMGPIQEVFGYWGNLNHPFVEVEDTAVGVVRFQNGALGTILLSNSQKPGFYGKIHVHGSTGASVGVQTEGGSPFISGVTETVDPPINDIWTVPGEESLLPQWQVEDTDRCNRIDIMSHYHRLQIQDFLHAILEGREPAVTAREGRKYVELFTAIYRSQRDGRPVKFPLDAVIGSDDFDGRLSKPPYP
jgi:UDP-N-acetyl-2-amino-2-deoxyglucuronate dehydrogenase